MNSNEDETLDLIDVELDLSDEVWVPIIGYEDAYMVSSCGQVKSLDRMVPHVNKDGSVVLHRKKGKLLTPIKSGQGYLVVGIEGRHHRIHRLVATAFIENPNELPLVNHMDGVKGNNHVSNLQWATYTDNIVHAYENKLRVQSSGIDHFRAKLSWDDVRYLRMSKGLTRRQLADIFGVEHSTINSVINYKSYKNEPKTEETK